MYSSKRTPWAVYILLAVFFCSVGFSGGYAVGLVTNPSSSTANLQKDFSQSNRAETIDTASDEIDFDLFWEVWDLVKTKHIDQPVTDVDLFYGAVSGIADAVGDPYTSYLTPELTEKFNENISGAFEGIGAEIGIKDLQLQIIAPLSGTPAEQAGLLPGDNIIKIDAVDTINLSLDEAVEKIRGPKGTTVVLSIYREGADDIADISVIRDTIKIPSVEYELKEVSRDRVAIITLSHFNEKAASDFAAVTQNILRDNPTGLILDLRNNPGGLLAESVEIGSHFIPDNLIVSEQFSDGKKTDYTGLGYGTLVGIPLVVLINEGSASASEILAGALQDYGLATVIGMTSYGKGSVQEFKILEDNSSLKITVAKWYTPNGDSIDGAGITPDIEVDRTIEDYEAERDPQLDRAIEELTN